VARADHQTELSRAVAKAFVTAGFSSTDLLTGQIALTDLPWQCPPLQCLDTIGGIPLYEYLDYPIGADANELWRFYKRGLEKLYVAPSLVANAQGWKNSGKVARSSSIGERNMRFSVPEDFPNHNTYNGHVFTLECAHVFVNSCKVMSDLTCDGSNYWVSTEFGDIGIRDGMVIDSKDWIEPMVGIVDVFLQNGRGQASTFCRYDLISKVRSVLNENAAMFDEFAGVDWALQALAKLSQDKLCGPLLHAIQSMMPDTFDAKRRIKILDEALDMLDHWVANDRVKVSSLREMLVPGVYSIGAFHNKIYNMTRPVPTILQNSTLKKIRDNLMAKRGDILKTLGPRERQALTRE